MYELFHWIQDIADTEFNEDDAHKFAENIWDAIDRKGDGEYDRYRTSN